MNIYFYELKANRKFTIIWLVILLLISFMITSFYPMFSNDMDAFIKMLSNYPENIRTAMGINLDGMGSMLGFYASFPLNIVLVCGAIEAMILGMSILSKEVRAKTGDFLHTKPVSRYQIVTSKILAIFTLITASNIIYSSSLYVLMSMLSDVSLNFSLFVLLMLILYLVQLIFMSMGIALSVIIPKVKSVLPMSMGLVFGLYSLGAFGDDKLRVIMPFKYFDTTYIMENVKYELVYFMLTLVIIFVFIFLTYIVYKNKDIESI